MKKVLSLLLAYVFLQVQTWALSGGPDYSQRNGGTASPTRFIGSYAGVLVPTSTTATVTTGLPSSSSVGLFALGIPESGLATGSALVFVKGVAFNGQITGVLDPDKGTLVAVISGTSNFDVVIPKSTISTGTTVTTTEEQTFQVFAQGSIKAKVREGSTDIFSGTSSSSTSAGFFASTTTTTAAGSTTAARIEGTASVDVFFRIDIDGVPKITSTTTFNVDGFKQTNTSTTTQTNFSLFGG